MKKTLPRTVVAYAVFYISVVPALCVCVYIRGATDVCPDAE